MIIGLPMLLRVLPGTVSRPHERTAWVQGTNTLMDALATSQSPLSSKHG